MVYSKPRFTVKTLKTVRWHIKCYHRVAIRILSSKCEKKKTYSQLNFKLKKGEVGKERLNQKLPTNRVEC